MKRYSVIGKQKLVRAIAALALVILTSTAVFAEDTTRAGGGGLFGALLEGMMSAANSSSKTTMSNVTVEKIPDQVYTGKAITPTVKVTFWEAA